MPNGWRTINSLVHKIRLHDRRGKGMAESFSRQKSRHAPQKEGGLKILCDLPPVWPRLVRPTNLMSRMDGKKKHKTKTQSRDWRDCATMDCSDFSYWTRSSCLDHGARRHQCFNARGSNRALRRESLGAMQHCLSKYPPPSLSILSVLVKASATCAEMTSVVTTFVRANFPSKHRKKRELAPWLEKEA